MYLSCDCTPKCVYNVCAVAKRKNMNAAIAAPMNVC